MFFAFFRGYKLDMNRKPEYPTLTGIVDVIAIGLAVATVLGFPGRVHWTFDLFAHFRVQYMQIGLVLIALLLWKRRHKRAVAMILLAALNYAFVLPYYFGKPQQTDAETARAMLINLNAANGNSEQVLEFVRKADPDLLVLEEVTPKWAEDLAVLRSEYKYDVSEPQAGCFGIMLLSRHPLNNGNVLEIGDAGVPSITTDVYLPFGEISVIATHPVPPVGPNYFRYRNTQLAALPAIVAQQPHPVLLIGDLNTTPWSPWFGQLIDQSELKNSMKGFGFQPTWHADIPFMKIPIDHVLHADDIVIHNRMIGPDVGSDHLPVIVDFTIP